MKKLISAILLTDVDNSSGQGIENFADGGNNTQDRIFLLSYTEARDYLYDFSLTPAEQVNARMSPTAYAVMKGAYAIDKDNGPSSGSTWRISPDLKSPKAHFSPVITHRRFYTRKTGGIQRKNVESPAGK